MPAKRESLLALIVIAWAAAVTSPINWARHGEKKELAIRHSVVAVLPQLKGLEATLASSGTY